MSRPGKFAKSSRIKQLRQFKRRQPASMERTITWEQVTDFLLGRYHLTRGGRVTALVDATVQRFLSEWLTTAQRRGEDQVQWPIDDITTTTVSQIGHQVPWQFYAIVVEQFADWQAFLLKEGPALPLQHRRQLVTVLTTSQFHRLIAEQLAVNLLTGMGISGTVQQREQLVAGLLVADRLQWSAVAKLFDPLGFRVTAPATSTTYEWLNDLLALKITSFDN